NHAAVLFEKTVAYSALLPDPFPNGIVLSATESIAIFLFVLSLISGIKTRRINYLYISYCILAAISFKFSINVHSRYNNAAFVVFNLKKHSACACIKGSNAIIFSDFDLNEKTPDFNFKMKNCLRKLGVHSYSFVTIENSTEIRFLNQRILFTDSEGWDSLEV